MIRILIYDHFIIPVFKKLKIQNKIIVKKYKLKVDSMDRFLKWKIFGKSDLK